MFQRVAVSLVLLSLASVAHAQTPQPALKSLRKAGINIVAIHQHMTNEEPRIIFFHYWGQGKAQDLAKAVRAAIDLTPTKVQS
jgi:predicted DNA-binding transcriptional regulator YafY